MLPPPPQLTLLLLVAAFVFAASFLPLLLIAAVLRCTRFQGRCSAWVSCRHTLCAGRYCARQQQRLLLSQPPMLRLAVSKHHHHHHRQSAPILPPPHTRVRHPLTPTRREGPQGIAASLNTRCTARVGSCHTNSHGTPRLPTCKRLPRHCSQFHCLLHRRGQLPAHSCCRCGSPCCGLQWKRSQLGLHHVRCMTKLLDCRWAGALLLLLLHSQGESLHTYIAAAEEQGDVVLGELKH